MYTYLFIAYTLILLLVGGIAGYYLSVYLRRDVGKQREPLAGVENQERAQDDVNGEEERQVETARVWRDASTNRLVAEIRGRRLTSESPLSDEQRARLTLLFSDLGNWLRPDQRTPPTPGPRPEGEVTPSQPQEEGETRFSPISSLFNALRSDVRLPAEPTDIISQIDDILQHILADSPLADRAVRLMNIPGRGMVIFVGLDTYDDIDAVPDERIRQAIRAAVAEWEARESEEDE